MHGLGGFGDFGKNYPAVARTVKEGSNVLGVIGGLWLGNFGRKQIDKLVNVQAAADGKFQWTSLISPLATVAIGGGIATIGHQIQKSDMHNDVAGEFVKHVGYGVIGAGGVALVKVTLDKDILAGLGGADSATDAKFFKESADMLKKLVEGNKGFKPELNGGMGYNPTNERVNEMNPEMIL
jgi:hypothetical protein